MSFWNESVLNTKFSISTRIYFFQTILIIFIKFYNYLTINKLPDTISFKKSEGKKVLWVSVPKLKRFINTLFIQIYAISLKDNKIALDRFSTQPTENFIGLIRMLSDNNNSFKNVIHNLSRYEFVNRVSPHIFTQPHPKRLNLGGCVLKESDVNFDFTNSPFQLSELLISYMEGKEFDKEIMKDFIQCLNRLQHNASYRSKHVPNATSGANILNRLITVFEFFM